MGGTGNKGGRGEASRAEAARLLVRIPARLALLDALLPPLLPRTRLRLRLPPTLLLPLLLLNSSRTRFRLRLRIPPTLLLPLLLFHASSCTRFLLCLSLPTLFFALLRVEEPSRNTRLLLRLRLDCVSCLQITVAISCTLARIAIFCWNFIIKRQI